MHRMDRSVLWRAAAVQAVSVTVLALVLGLSLPHSFFEEWGWFAGPAAWLVCAAITAAVVRLPTVPVLAGAAIAGTPSLIAVAVGVHWLGVVIGVPVFALWCARLARDRRLTAHAV
jgi:hypothetical protein